LNFLQPATAQRDQVALSTRLGFAVFLEEDGVISEELLIGLKSAGYDGIEPNCFQVRHLEHVIQLCQKVGIGIHGIPTGRWMNVDEASEDYRRYTTKAFDVLHEGAAIAASVDAPLILGLVRGRATVAEADAKAFLTFVVTELLQRIPQLKILVEPIAHGEAAWPHTIPEGHQLITTLNQPSVRLLADSYHIARSGEDVNIEQYRDSISHLHIRDHQKQIPRQTAPEYASILHLWREGNRILSFEPNIQLSTTVEHAINGACWLATQ
jgi:sugar phosphate isomerase/epimerase